MAQSPPREPQGTASLHYLTIQDMLWINLQVTKRVNPFDYARLEEAVFYQYSYGSSRDLLKQAGQFLRGFLKLKPFGAGNEATAFLAFAAFLQVNETRLTVDDAGAADLFAKISQGANLEGASSPDGHHGEDLAPKVEATVEEILFRYPSTVAALAAKS